MQNSLSSAVHKMGSNFLVAAFVPAMGFVVMSTLAFQPILPKELTDRFGAGFVQTTVYVLLFTTMLGFTLYTLSTYIYKAFEGYTFILSMDTPLRRAALQRQRRRIRKIEFELKQVKKELMRIEKKLSFTSEDTFTTKWHKKRRERYELRQKFLKDRQYGLIAFRNENFPPAAHLVLPTRFGNILKASEMYPGRYGIDAVPIWDRLAHVIPPGGGEDDLGGMSMIDDANNQCLFLLNTTLLAVIFTFLSILAVVYEGVLLWANSNSVQLLSFMPTNLEKYLYMEAMGIYFVLALFAASTAWFFYKASLLNVSEFGAHIRVAYDLYRSRLLKQLNLPLPPTLEIERLTWRALSDFFVGGDELGEVDLNFYYYEKQNAQTEPEYVSVGDIDIKDN
jgi:hypothetical protein